MGDLSRIVDLIDGTMWGKTQQKYWRRSQEKRIPIMFRGFRGAKVEAPYRLDPDKHVTSVPDAGVVVLHGTAAEIGGVSRDTTIFDQIFSEQSKNASKLEEELVATRQERDKWKRKALQLTDEMEEFTSRHEGGSDGGGPAVWMCEANKHKNLASSWRNNDMACPESGCLSEKHTKVA